MEQRTTKPERNYILIDHATFLHKYNQDERNSGVINNSPKKALMHLTIYRAGQLWKVMNTCLVMWSLEEMCQYREPGS